MSPISGPVGEKSRLWAASPALLKMIVGTLVLAGGAYLMTRHSDHLIRYLPYAILLACPLLHGMHHRRHKH